MATARISRRGFLKSLGAVTATVALAGPGSLPQAVAKEHTMKFGLYGINMGPCNVPAVAARVAQLFSAIRLDFARITLIGQQRRHALAQA